MTRLLVASFGLVLLLSSSAAGADKPDLPGKPPSVFDLPAIQVRLVQLQAAIQALFGAGDYTKGEQAAAQVIALIPHDPNGHYNHACALARQGKTDDAIESLTEAVRLGFNNVKHIEGDADLESLRDDMRFVKLLEKAAATKPPPNPWQWKVAAAPVEDGQAWVREENTAWDARLGVFRSLFKFAAAEVGGEQAVPKPAIIKGHGKIGELLRRWYAEGTAAGNRGDLYDNHDGDHSNMAYGQFPQLTRLEFSDEVKKRRFHSGLQTIFLYNGITIGNSSTAMTGGPFWRSQPRMAYANPRLAAALYAQYINNHLYFYPEHRDHDAGHNGDNGYGDVYPANTPYVIISQGSSGSDRAFMDSVACTLAALRPEVKRKLAQTGTLMAAVQMIFRISMKDVGAPEDYLTGKAHPTVFDGKQIDTLKMVKMAHDITEDTPPPMIQLSVVEEDESLVGRDYFAPAPRQRLFTTPAAIARVHRTANYRYRIVISAEGSRDLNQRRLTWHWRVLRGDPALIEIKPINKAQSIAEIVVPYHARRPIVPGSKMESNRVDIGVFVHNGKYYSAPAFVTVFTLDNEKRVYDEKDRIRSIEYSDPAAGGNYSDPMIAVAKVWRDEYQYDDEGRLVGWTRHRSDATEPFTASGELIMKRDEAGRPTETGPVKYVAKPRDRNKPPILEQRVAESIAQSK